MPFLSKRATRVRSNAVRVLPTRAIPGRRALIGRAVVLAALLVPLPGCQSLSGNLPTAQVRIIDATPDAPALDVYQGNGILAYNLAPGTVTSYVPVVPGTYSTVINAGGTRQQIIAASSTFTSGGQYTVIISNSSLTPQEIILKDQTAPAPPGQVALRFVAEATRTPAVDLYLIPSGSTIAAIHPFLTNITFGINTGYLNLPAGTYTLAVLPSGATPRVAGATLYTSSAISYPSGSAKTFVLIDQPDQSHPDQSHLDQSHPDQSPLALAGLQVIAATDFDPTIAN